MTTSNPGPAITSTPEPQSSIGNLQKHAVLTVALTPTAITASTTSQQSFSALGLGLQVGDIVAVLAPPSFVAGVSYGASTVTAADTVQITFANATAGTPTPPSGNYVIEVLRVQPYFTQNASYMSSF